MDELEKLLEDLAHRRFWNPHTDFQRGYNMAIRDSVQRVHAVVHAQFRDGCLLCDLRERTGGAQ